MRNDHSTENGQPSQANGNGNGSAPSAADNAKPISFLVNENNRDEIRKLGDDLAIVSPLVDGRMKDSGERK